MPQPPIQLTYMIMIVNIIGTVMIILFMLKEAIYTRSESKWTIR